jgi:hypothetical protein
MAAGLRLPAPVPQDLTQAVAGGAADEGVLVMAFWGMTRLGIASTVTVGLTLAATPALAQGSTPYAAAALPVEALRAPIPPQAYRTPEDGFTALAAAIRAHDERRLLAVLGEQARELVRSGDAMADRAARERFTAAYATRHEILRPAPNRAVLQIGEDGWPLPIPLVARSGTWRFDASQGAQALVDRRVGLNEFDTVKTLREIAEAQAEYARTAGRPGGLRAYARRFFSTPGQHDGLYWPGEPESPLGPLVAKASAGGYDSRHAGDQPQPFYGYLFRILGAQGPAAPGGALNYVVDGRMVGGFAVLAWPVQHGVSGVMSFMISHHGTVWESNLGLDTRRIARGITAFDPGLGWRPVVE